MAIEFEDEDDGTVSMVISAEADPDDIDDVDVSDEDSTSSVPTAMISEFQKSLVEPEDETDDIPIPALTVTSVTVAQAMQPSEETFEYAVIGVSEIELGKEEDIEINAIDPAGDIGEDPDITTDEED